MPISAPTSCCCCYSCLAICVICFTSQPIRRFAHGFLHGSNPQLWGFSRPDTALASSTSTRSPRGSSCP